MLKTILSKVPSFEEIFFSRSLYQQFNEDGSRRPANERGSQRAGQCDTGFFSVDVGETN